MTGGTQYSKRVLMIRDHFLLPASHGRDSTDIGVGTVLLPELDAPATHAISLMDLNWIAFENSRQPSG